MRLEVICGLEIFSDQPVVVDLSIDCEGNGIVLVGEWLRPTVNTDDAQTLVGKNCNRLLVCHATMEELKVLLVLLAT